MKKCIAMLLLMIATGCVNVNPAVEPVKPWEGHFFTAEEAKASVESIQLEENESVWILSNRTLKRVLKNNTTTK